MTVAEGTRRSTRRRILVLPTVGCANIVGEGIAERTHPNVAVVSHQHGCGHLGGDLTLTQLVLAGLAAHDNVVHTILVSLGCETNGPTELRRLVTARGATAEMVSIQGAGGVESARLRVLSALEDAAIREARVPLFAGPRDVGFLTVAVLMERAAEPRFSGFVDVVALALERAGMRVVVARQLVRPPSDQSSKSPTRGTPALWASAPVQDSPAIRALELHSAPPRDLPLGGGDAARLTVLSAIGSHVVVFLTARGIGLSSPVAPTLTCAVTPAAQSLGDGVDVPFSGPSTPDAIAEAVLRVAGGGACLADGRSDADVDIPRIAPFY